MMNEMNNKLKQGYDSAELPEEVRLKVREEFLAAAECSTQTERSITVRRRLKRPIAAVLIAAAALTVTITAGAATGVLQKMGIVKNMNIDAHLGEGAADMAASNVQLQESVSAENGYMRVTSDAVFFDGTVLTVFLTTEILPDAPESSIDKEDWFEWLDYDFFYEDGTPIRGGDGGSYKTDRKANALYGRYTLKGVEPGRRIVAKAKDHSDLFIMESSLSDEERDEFFYRKDYAEFYDSMIHPDRVIGLTLTFDATPNVTPVHFVSDDGKALDLTPYCYYTERYSVYSDDYYGDITLIDSTTGERKEIHSAGGSGGISGGYLCQLDELVLDIDRYDMLEVKDVGTFYKQQ